MKTSKALATSSSLLTKARTFVIASAKNLVEASEIRIQIKAEAGFIKTNKEKMMRPLLDAVEVERGRWRKRETEIKEALDHLDRSMIDYQTEAKREADEKAEKIAARVGPGRGKLSAETALAQLDEINTPEKVIESDNGATGFRTYQMFAVEDITKLPAEYLLPNDQAIRKAMENSVKLPGVRYYTEERPVNRR